MLSVVQAVNIAAIATTLFLVRKSNRVCPHHTKVVGAPVRRRGGAAEPSQMKPTTLQPRIKAPAQPSRIVGEWL